jgi:ribosomal protein S18 acetylase RimI-like enzyme
MDAPLTLLLPDQRRATIRATSVADAEHVVELDRAVVVAGEGVVQDLGQVRNVEEARRHIDAFYRDAAAGSASLSIVAEVEGASPPIAGSAELRQLTPALCRHVGVLSVGVHPRYQRLGLGRALMRALIDHARTCELTRLELYVRDDNYRAQALYRSLGFVHECTRRKFIKTAEGRYVDDHVFALLW